jgi:hypothetical protein
MGDTDERERSPGAVFTQCPSQQHRLNKTDYGNAVWHPLNTHRTDKSNSNKTDNTMISNSLKAQGKGIMHPVLTEVSLRHS